jgi:DmsE family decaheme c-type cytochrome
MTMRRPLIPLLVLLAAPVVLGAVLATAQDLSSSPGDSVDGISCADCHGDVVETFQGNPHSVLGTDAWADTGTCSGCHGDGTAHIEEGGGLNVGGLMGFGEGTTALARIEACQNCHGDVHPGFQTTAHAFAGLDCSSCHTIHGNNLSQGLLAASQQASVFDREDFGDSTATCAGCHGDIVSRFQFNERHKLNEGILDCTSCHNPHEPAQRTQLGGFDQTCISCHRDKDGPFVFEHGSQRVEGCVACHDPHGSPNRHMLTFQSVGELCYSCHATVPGFHSRFTADTVCTNCHSTIHGSNFDPFFLN